MTKAKVDLSGFRDYLVAENYSEATISAYMRAVRHFHGVVEKVEEPNEINKADIQKYKLWCIRDMKYDTNSLLGKYSGVTHYLKHLGWKSEDIPLKIPKKVVKNKVPFTREEIQRLFDVTKQHPRDHAIFKVLYYTQLRRGELENLNIDDVDFQRQKLRVNAGKGNKYAEINIHPDALKAIEDYLPHRIPSDDGDDALFTGIQGKRFQKWGIFHIIKKYSALAKIKKRAYPHLFRISSITHMAQKGLSIKEIQAQSRHDDLKTLMGYIQLSDEEVKDAYMKGLSFNEPQQPEPKPLKKPEPGPEIGKKDIEMNLLRQLALGNIDQNTYVQAMQQLNGDRQGGDFSAYV